MLGATLDRRLHFVVGKGGVGKTTVAAALARLLTRRGRRTLAVEVDDARRLSALLGASGTTGTPTPVAPGLSVVAVEGRAALEEYLGLIIPVKRLLATVFSSRIYQYFVAAAPGLKELMTVGKIWYETTRLEGGRPAWDAVVVDAPATGHSLQYLRMPQAARDTFGAGLVQREAAKVVELLRDPRTTAVHLVTLAEEMPVAETLETHAQLVGPLAMLVGSVIVNRVHHRRFSPAVLAALREAAKRAGPAERALVRAVCERAAEETGWSDINAAHLARLRAAIRDVPIVELPFLFVEEFDRAELERLSRELEVAGAARAAVSAVGP
ncbi:MAG: ArsA family ATPase [Deltaproteobacteria bacterium]|nr:MAG: ArsA family ATPase [Deltaproteobacteria bacterium]